MPTLICPHTENCIVYEDWVAGSGDRRIDVISKMTNDYSCLAMSAYNDPQAEGGVADSEYIKSRIKGNRATDCSHITLLNLLSKIGLGESIL